MLATRTPGRCVHCAYRAHLFHLQSRRLRTSATASRRFLPSDIFKDAAFREKENYRPRSGREKHSVKGFKFGEGRSGAGPGDTTHKVLRFGPGDSKYGSTRAKPGNLSFKPAREPDIDDVVRSRLKELKEELQQSPVVKQLQKDDKDEGAKAESFSKIWKAFTRKLLGVDAHPWSEKQPNSNHTLKKDLRDTYRSGGQKSLDQRIKYAFYDHTAGARFTDSDIKNQQTLADLRYPSEWYPATRSRKRTIHLHVGPTNSGKTYHALQRLEAANTGVYAGPLRLLAHEVYSRMNAKGRACNLITGEERRTADTQTASNYLSACTVEMVPLNANIDVAVIDEIQMIGNKERGWAWTQALMGVQATEVHLCGEERTVPLIKQICASIGDKLEIHKYERLSPLRMADSSLEGDLRRLRKGDCIVSFSVMGIHALRQQIEKQTGRQVATVYGSLPPETRAQQARLFNDPDNDYDYLVASDAVGMGLNLAIKRIIFESSSKYDGSSMRPLPIADIKQIAGRAGRYRTAAQATQKSPADQDLAAAKGDTSAGEATDSTKTEENVGIVTTLEQFDFPIVAAAMAAEPEPIHTAGIFPPQAILERFASYFPPGTPFSYILMRLHELSQMHSRFHLCGLKDTVWIADLIEPVEGISISDRNIICAAPAGRNDPMWTKLMPAYARLIAEQGEGHLADIEELPLEILEAPVSANRTYLKNLESLHKGITAYLWLSYRFAGIFRTRPLAFHVKELVEEKIEEVLAKFSFSEKLRKQRAAQRQQQMLHDLLDPASTDEVDMDDNADDPAAAEDGESAAGAETNEKDLDEQTSLVGGGDHFSGEDDLELGGPSETELLDEDKEDVSSFAAWRSQQRRGESQGSREDEDDKDDEDARMSQAFNEGQEDPTPTVAEAMGDFAAEEETGLESEVAASPEQSGSDLEAAITPETEIEEEEVAVGSQVAPPEAEEEVPSTPAPVASQSQFGGGLPPKHLSHVDVNASELERNAESRP